jgi:sporulation protein YlmC with PRC-barrel domain
MSTTSDPLGRGGETRIIGEGSASAEGPGPYVMAASTLEGDKVMTSDGEDVGKIKEIMLDVYSGRVAYAVMSVGGFLGIGDKLLAIPWNALTLDTNRKCFQLSATSEVVKNAPGFDKDHWPSMADATWASELHNYYGSAPYWSAGRKDVGTTGLGSETGRTSGLGSGMAPEDELPH